MEKFDAIYELGRLAEVTVDSTNYDKQDWIQIVSALAIVQALQAMADAIRHYEVWGR